MHAALSRRLNWIGCRSLCTIKVCSARLQRLWILPGTKGPSRTCLTVRCLFMPCGAVLIQVASGQATEQKAVWAGGLHWQASRPDLHRRSFSKYGTEAAGLVRRSASSLSWYICKMRVGPNCTACSKSIYSSMRL